MKKKYLLFSAMAVAVALSSCDMDKTPYDALPDTEAMQTPTDFTNARVGLYSGLRSSVGGGAFYNAPEIQCDGFNAVAGFSNTYGDMYYWDFTSQTGEMETVYGNYQAVIARANYIIDGYNKCDFNAGGFTNDDMKKIAKPTKGDAFFTRAYCIFMLSQYFCDAYNPSTANDENSGVAYRLDYAPSSSPSTYPGRHTLTDTYKQVSDDLDSADVYVSDAGEAGYSYISKDAITALRARLALNAQKYEDAANYATSLINSQKYTLAASVEDMEDLWHQDGGMETILQLACANAQELPASTGSSYLPGQKGAVPDYIPTKTLVDLYSAKDYRKAVYFKSLQINTNSGASGEVLALDKYADQGALCDKYGSSARFTIEPKVFRIAEMYLIAAEAYLQSNNLPLAAQYLNDLERERIEGYQDQTFASKDELWAELKNEREREMVAEGSRLFDLKRWHMGVKRGEPQQLNLCMLPGSSTTGLDKPADSNRLTWPIPKHEIDVYNIKQNPGY